MSDLLTQLMKLDERDMAYVINAMSDAERVGLWTQLNHLDENPYYRFRGDMVSFVRHGLKEATWSKQDEVLAAIHQHRKVVVAASHSTGKSYIAARAAAGVALSWPPELVRVQTTATNFRQVKGILWPYINRLHRRHELPGEIHTTSWKIGTEEIGAGFAAVAHNEASVSGFHADGELLLVVDEGGGIHPVLGQAFNNILTGTGHSLVIGNFPTDSDDTWFNRIWESDEWHQIRISAFDTPNFPRPHGKSFGTLEEVHEFLRYAEDHPDDPVVQTAYEPVGTCTSCPPVIEPHTIAKHLTDLEWVEGVAAEFGSKSAYFRTRVLAEPARDVVDKALPISWLEAAKVGEDYEPEPAPVKLGVDVASDGGDEFVIARAIGLHAEVVHASSGGENQNVMVPTGTVALEIDKAEAYHLEHGITEPVLVKIDAIGIGAGVWGRLDELNREGRWRNVRIIQQDSSARPHNRAKFPNQRSELWWTMRGLLQPNPKTGEPGVLTVAMSEDRAGLRLLKQLNAPKWSTNSAGHIVVQPKAEVKKKTGSSPDRADAVLIALYDPPDYAEVRKGAEVITQDNPWAVGSMGAI